MSCKISLINAATFSFTFGSICKGSLPSVSAAMAESDKSADLANPDATVAGRTTHDRRRSAGFSDASNASDQATNQATKPLQKSKAHAGKGGEIFSLESFRRNWIWFLVGVLVFAAILLPIV
jgi:hypothetical protein